MNVWTERLGWWHRWHAYVLESKGVIDADGLRAAIRHDQVVAVAAARSLLRGVATEPLLRSFFSDHAAVRDEIMSASTEDSVNHLGFQIREPLDIWLEGLALWSPRLGVDVIGVKRFTASEAFRVSVGAFAEMAQVWLAHNGTTIELELFDIHRPNPTAAGPPAADLRNTRAMLAATQPDVLRTVLTDDDVWHYGVLITDEPTVERLHARFRELVSIDDCFRLRTEATVGNVWHGSVHTKLTNLALGTEIEFLTYRVDWEERSRR